jgi:hypothetical protein
VLLAPAGGGPAVGPLRWIEVKAGYLLPGVSMESRLQSCQRQLARCVVARAGPLLLHFPRSFLPVSFAWYTADGRRAARYVAAYGPGAVLHTECLLEPAAAAAWLGPLAADVVHLGRALPAPGPGRAKAAAASGACGGGVMAERPPRKGQDGPRRVEMGREGPNKPPKRVADVPIWLSPAFNQPCPCGKVWATGRAPRCTRRGRDCHSAPPFASSYYVPYL